MRFTLIFILFTSVMCAQKASTDIGAGDREKVKIAISILNKIERNQEVNIEEYFLDGRNFKGKEWDNYIKQIQSEFPNTDNSLPASAVSPGENLWYERTYYEKLDNEIKYYFQVYFDLVEIDSEIKIKNMIFRKGEKIVSRDKEIRRLGDRSVPPPPPAIGF